MYLQSSSPHYTLENSVKKAISYIRWSTSGRQSRGDSLERQLSKTKAFCAKHKLVLQEPRIDAGKSASKAKHTAPGSELGKLLEEIKKGEFPRDVVLIVESFDRLSRETVSKAVAQFLLILDYGIEIVTLMDEQWYSAKKLEKDSTPLLMSMVYMMRAYDESATKAYRLAQLWKRKRDRAVNQKQPMTSICPAWLAYDKHGKTYKVNEERAKKVRLIYWLWNKGWSRHRIAKLFNLHDRPRSNGRPGVAVWGKKKRHTAGWHHSYIDKILHTRAVLGEFTPHSTKNPRDERALAGKRKPATDVIKGYYPAIVPEAVFNKAQARSKGPKGPIGKSAANLFQGLLKDGENPGYTMYFRDHGHDWQYVVSDIRRVKPKEPVFSWRYDELEDIILSYITDLDWRNLTAAKSEETRAYRERLLEIEGRLQQINATLTRLAELAEVATDIQEIAAKMNVYKAERDALLEEGSKLKTDLLAKENFLTNEGQELIRKLAGKTTFEARHRLRLAIRQNVKRIDLFRQAPDEMAKLLKGDRQELAKRIRISRAIKLTFTNGAIRWITARQMHARLEGNLPKMPDRMIDERGGTYIDKRLNSAIHSKTGKIEQDKKGTL